MRGESEEQRLARGPVRLSRGHRAGTGGSAGGTAEESRAAARTGDEIIGPGSSGGLRLRWALLTGLVGGLALTAAFPPYGVSPLAPVGPALLPGTLWADGL